MPALRAGGRYKINASNRGRFCRGLSVPFTVNVHGEPCSPGRRGHDFSQPESPSVAEPVPFQVSGTIYLMRAQGGLDDFRRRQRAEETGAAAAQRRSVAAGAIADAEVAGAA